MKASAQKHLNAAAEYIAIAEAADSSSVAYRKAAEEIKAAMDEDPTLTQAEVGERIGKGNLYVSRLLRALTIARDSGHEFRVDWQSGSNKRADLERRVPTQHKDRVEMAQTLLSDPKVAKAAVSTVIAKKGTHASRAIDNAVHEHRRKEAEKLAAERQRNTEAQAVPLPAYVPKMTIKIGDWAREMDFLVDDLDALPDAPGVERLLDAVIELEAAAGRWRQKLDRRPDLTVIEGVSRSA